MFFRTCRSCLLLTVLWSASASAETWTLQNSLAQAMKTAPELQQAQAEVAAQREQARLSGMWPDPSVEFRVDNKLGKDDGSGGLDLTDVTISQPIPVSRLKHQQAVADAYVRSAELAGGYKALAVQNRVAQAFHQLQFASAHLEMAEKRLQLADDLRRQSGKNAQGVVVRYLTPLEKMRLDIIREEAHQQLTNAEGKYSEAVNEFVRLLAIDPQDVGAVASLNPVDELPQLAQLQAAQQQHPQLNVQAQNLQAAQAEIDLARTSQLADPTISLSRSRDTFNDGRDDVYGIMFNVQIPIHDRKDAAVSKARYQASQQRIELQRMKRDLQINLKRSYTHSHHLLEQAKDYQQRVLKPAQNMLRLTQRGFNSGELNMLSLVDANSTYFDARLRYLELIYQTHAELADLRFYAGQLLDVNSQSMPVTDQGGI
jgi:cobalt-zinc-cadmium efflux system outer membrane protein